MMSNVEKKVPIIVIVRWQKSISKEHSTGIDCRENKICAINTGKEKNGKYLDRKKSAEAKESPMWQ